MKLTAETLIKSDRETVWRLSQTPLLHARWDLRFTDIEYLPRESAAEPQRFRYATRIGFGLAVKGWGETIGDPERSTSALRFGSTDAKSIIREGDRKSTRLNSSHSQISYAVFCLKKKKKSRRSRSFPASCARSCSEHRCDASVS